MLTNILDNKQIADGIFELSLYAPEIARKSTPGQFVNLYVPGGDMLLPRPFGIASTDESRVNLVYAVVGKGTERLSGLDPGDTIRIFGPNGKGFDVGFSVSKTILIGGGLGIPPLVFAAQKLPDKHNTALLGFRDNTYFVDEFNKYCDDVFSISEGKILNDGISGNVIDLLNMHVTDNSIDCEGALILACGPIPMLKAVSEWALAHEMDAQLSLEARMGCGYGACVGCTIELHAGQNNTVRQKVCTDGPVFNVKQIAWDKL